ncbi:MAG: quinolinate synthase NadA, partial [Muribaculaceae bacterium]|nr:quinolinate synthase NadA [Muribaculaceae bacterium]
TYIKLNSLEKLRDCLIAETPEVNVDPELARKALRPINRMLELSK